MRREIKRKGFSLTQQLAINLRPPHTATELAFPGGISYWRPQSVAVSLSADRCGPQGQWEGTSKTKNLWPDNDISYHTLVSSSPPSRSRQRLGPLVQTAEKTNRQPTTASVLFAAATRLITLIERSYLMVGWVSMIQARYQNLDPRQEWRVSRIRGCEVYLSVRTLKK